MESREWYRTTKSSWQQPAGNSGGQSSHDTWEHAKPKGKWKEVSAEFEAICALLKEKITWNKRRVRKEKLTFIQRPKEERDRDKLSDLLEEFLGRKEDEDEATCLIEEMRKNLVVAQQESFEAEQSLCSALREYVDTFAKDRGRPKTIITELWQLMQSWDTKNLNLDDGIEEILSKMKQMGGSEEVKTRRLWAQDEGEDQQVPQP